MKKIVIFASGSGSNAENIISYFKKSNIDATFFVFCNNRNAKVLERAKNLKVQSLTFNKLQLADGLVANELNNIQPDLIVLAGFLLQFPLAITSLFPHKIINIHPALLPKYGGKGMYGMHVHKAVLDNNETETGITIHYVNENYDEGEIIFQKSVAILSCKTSEEIAAKIHDLEMENFPRIVAELVK